MNAFKTQAIRIKHKVTMQEEYVLGMVRALEPISTTRVLNLAEKQNAMSPATTHKYLKQIERKKLIHKVKAEDQRMKEFETTGRGISFLEELKHAYR